MKKLELEKVIEGVAKRIEQMYDGDNNAKSVADDVRHSVEGFMEEEEIGAMIVGLVSMLAKENKD